MAGGYEGALVAFQEALDNPSLDNIGIIVDADSHGPDQRWAALKLRLAKKFPGNWLDEIAPSPEGIVIEGNQLLFILEN